MSDQRDDRPDGADDADAGLSDAGGCGDERERIRREKEREMMAEGTPVEPVTVEGNAHFDSLVDEGVVLLVFHEEWEGPCQVVRPKVGAVAEVMPVTVATVDVSDHPAISVKYDVEVLPTFVVVSDGEAVERLTGVQDEMELGRAVDGYV